MSSPYNYSYNQRRMLLYQTRPHMGLKSTPPRPSDIPKNSTAYIVFYACCGFAVFILLLICIAFCKSLWEQGVEDKKKKAEEEAKKEKEAAALEEASSTSDDQESGIASADSDPYELVDKDDYCNQPTLRFNRTGRSNDSSRRPAPAVKITEVVVEMSHVMEMENSGEVPLDPQTLNQEVHVTCSAGWRRDLNKDLVWKRTTFSRKFTESEDCCASCGKCMPQRLETPYLEMDKGNEEYQYCERLNELFLRLEDKQKKQVIIATEDTLALIVHSEKTAMLSQILLKTQELQRIAVNKQELALDEWQQRYRRQRQQQRRSILTFANEVKNVIERHALALPLA